MVSIVNKTNSSKSLIIDIKLKDAIKMDIVKIDKSETYSQENALPTNGFYRNLHQLLEQHGHPKRQATDLIWSKNTFRLHRIV